nr:PREDICTED: laminin subunit gamma-2-like [Paralichthys olivaceus]
MFGSMPSNVGLLSDATKLSSEAEDLKTKARDLTRDVKVELDDARNLEAEAEQAAIGADAAFSNAGRTRDAVGKTLRDISRLLDNMNQPGTVDESRLKQLEASLADAQRDVEAHLRPRFRDMEQQEDALRRRLTTINLDIDTIQRDIKNLEEILSKIPPGCFNSPPIEEA